ncbi:MAG: hypothetical protein WCP28_20670 [Actinomycetes bacterium]
MNEQPDAQHRAGHTITGTLSGKTVSIPDDNTALTPQTKFDTKEDLLAYKEQFLVGLKATMDGAGLAQPRYVIMGMS